MVGGESLAEVVLAPHQSPGPPSLTPPHLTAAPLPCVPHWTGLGVAGVLTVRLGLSLLSTLETGQTAGHLSGPRAATTGSRALAPLPRPPLDSGPRLRLHHCSLGLQDWLTAGALSLTSLLRLRPGLLTAELGLQLVSRPLVETLDPPPPEAATTGGAALTPLPSPPAGLLTVGPATALGLPGSSPHCPTPGLVWLQPASHPVIAGDHPGLPAATPGAAGAPPPDLPPVARQVVAVARPAPTLSGSPTGLPIYSRRPVVRVVTGENHTGGGVDWSGVVRAVGRGETLTRPVLTVVGSGPQPGTTVRGAD